MNNLFTVKVQSMGAVGRRQASKTDDNPAIAQPVTEIDQNDYRVFVAERRAESGTSVSHTVSNWLANRPSEKT
jgi:hypothetical protein